MSKKRQFVSDSDELNSHVEYTGKEFKWRRRFNVYTLIVGREFEGRAVRKSGGTWIRHTVILKGGRTYFNQCSINGRWKKTYMILSDKGYQELMAAILLGGLRDE